MITYSILCGECGKIVGYIDYKEEPSPSKLAYATSGYICGDCAVTTVVEP